MHKKVILFRFLQLIVSLVSRRNLVLLCKVIIALSYPFLTSTQKTIKKNLYLIGCEVTNQKVQETLFYYLISLMDFLRVKYIKLQDIAKRTTLKGCNYLNAALSQKRGAILVTGHLGNWELAGIYLSSLGYPLSAVVEDIPAMNNFLNSLRVKTGMEVILTSQPQAIINAIKKNRIVVLLADRPVTQHGIEISFLNGRKKIPLGPAYFAYRFKVPVLVGYFVYTSNANCFAAEIVPLSFPEDLNIKMLTIALIKQLSSYISKYPTQWFVMRNEWC